MKIIISLFALFVCNLSFALFAQSVEQKPNPRDTSFTPYQVWIKIKKEFPEAIIVNKLQQKVM